MNKKHYEQRDVEELGQFYTDHVLAMTAEDLHEKPDIAAELAYRDAEIERLRSAMGRAIAKLSSNYEGIPSPVKAEQMFEASAILSVALHTNWDVE